MKRLLTLSLLLSSTVSFLYAMDTQQFIQQSIDFFSSMGYTIYPKTDGVFYIFSILGNKESCFRVRGHKDFTSTFFDEYKIENNKIIEFCSSSSHDYQGKPSIAPNSNTTAIKTNIPLSQLYTAWKIFMDNQP